MLVHFFAILIRAMQSEMKSILGGGVFLGPEPKKEEEVYAAASNEEI